MNNLDIYNAVRSVPIEAQKEIKGGRLSGKTDINPMWRIKTLTEQFGVCGVGWKYTIAEKRLEKADNGEIAAFVDINLFIKINSEWSEAIPGTGGSSFVANEKNGPFVSDECFKMALTDAISVACKALGFGADVYWNGDKTKYDKPDYPESLGGSPHNCHDCGNEILAAKGKTAAQIIAGSKNTYQVELCADCIAKRYKGATK
jgi:hypothetical protein